MKSHIYSFTRKEKEQVIQKGDLFTATLGLPIGLNTDCQQHAYVLHDDETEVPEFLRIAFKKGNRLQDILTSNMKKVERGIKF